MTNEIAHSTVRPKLDKYGYNCIGKHIGMVVIGCAPLFIAAGTTQWDRAWLYTAIMGLGWAVLTIVLIVINPELLNERGKRTQQVRGVRSWDWPLLALYSTLLVITPIIAGLDYRFGWSKPSSQATMLLGAALMIAGFVLLTGSMAVNRHFEAMARIQTERNHHVITTGPYAWMRHPGYLAVILHFVAVPMILGTQTAWIPALIGTVLFVVRTTREDQMLRDELPGYAAYAATTRWRLLPLIW